MNHDRNNSKVKERNQELSLHPIYRSKAILEYHASDTKQAIEPYRYISKSNQDHKRNIKRNAKARCDHTERRSISNGSFDSEEDHESSNEYSKHGDESYWTENQSDSFESDSLDQNSQCSCQSGYTSRKKQQRRRQTRRKRVEHKSKRCITAKKIAPKT